MSDAPAAKIWTLYLIRCSDNSLYTGITTDVARRLSEHMSMSGLAASKQIKSASKQGKGAKFFRSRQPLALVFEAKVCSRSEALKLEYRIKQLSKPEKEALVTGKLSLDGL